MPWQVAVWKVEQRRARPKVHSKTDWLACFCLGAGHVSGDRHNESTWVFTAPNAGVLLVKRSRSTIDEARTRIETVTRKRGRLEFQNGALTRESRLLRRESPHLRFWERGDERPKRRSPRHRTGASCARASLGRCLIRRGVDAHSAVLPARPGASWPGARFISPVAEPLDHVVEDRRQEDAEEGHAQHAAEDGRARASAASPRPRPPRSPAAPRPG